MAKIKLGEFLPDQERINNPGLMSVVNAKPVIDGYLPMKGTSDLATGALTGDGRFVRAFTAEDNTVSVFAGDDTSLYQLNALLTITNISYSTGAYTSGEWRTAIFGDRVMAVNGPTHQGVQSFLLGTDSIFSTIANAPQAGSIAVVKNVFTFLGNITEDATSSNDPGSYIPHRVRWSASNDPTLYYPSDALLAASLAGFQDLNNSGQIQNISGGAQPFILGENRIFRATFEGGQTIFRFDTVEEDHGCLAGNTMISFLGSVYYLAKDGWYKIDGSNTLTPIGNGKIDRFFFSDLDNTHLDKISATVNPDLQLLMWAYPGPGNTDGSPNRVLIYNYVVDKWAVLQIDINCIGTIASTGYTLEELDTFGNLDGGLLGPLDSDIYKGDTIVTGAIVAKIISNFGGTTLTASFLTGDLELNDTMLSLITQIFPIVDATAENITLQTNAVNTSQDVLALGLDTSLNRFGYFPIKSKGRYHRLKLSVSGEWVSAKGTDIRFKKLGGR